VVREYAVHNISTIFTLLHLFFIAPSSYWNRSPDRTCFTFLISVFQKDVFVCIAQLYREFIIFLSLILSFLHLLTCVYIVRASFLLSTTLPPFWAEPILPSSLIFVMRKLKSE
jgi:hypothetical protein